MTDRIINASHLRAFMERAFAAEGFSAEEAAQIARELDIPGLD